MRAPPPSIDIAPPLDAVSRNLGDAASRPEWNPFITSLLGPVEVGAHLQGLIPEKLGEGS
jgi:hypothetical protein